MDNVIMCTLLHYIIHIIIVVYYSYTLRQYMNLTQLYLRLLNVYCCTYESY